jgi:predicted Zn finger-like uncharacterized protein
MDVRCEKCQTEYELDEARLKPGGVTVKCTNCGHMFRIRKRTITSVGTPPLPRDTGSPPPLARDTASPPALARDTSGPRSRPISPRPLASGPTLLGSAPGPVGLRYDSLLDDVGQLGADEAPTTPDRQWLIRLDNGEQKNCRELATLQQWIIAGVVTREALISRTGKTWKRLGDVVELGQYFTIADEARANRERMKSASKPGASREPPGTLPGYNAQAAGGTILPDDPDDDEDERRTTQSPPRLGGPTPPPLPPRGVVRTPPAGAATATAPTEPAAVIPPPVRRPATTPPPPPARRIAGAPTPQPPAIPQGNRATATWATDGVSPEAPRQGPAGPVSGKLSAIPDEPAFAGRVRLAPGESTFEPGQVRAVDDDDDVLPVRRGSRAGMIVLVTSLLVMAAAAAVVYLVVLRDRGEPVAQPVHDAAVVATATPDAAADASPAPETDAAAAVPPVAPLAAERGELAADIEPRLRAAAQSLDGKSDAPSQALRARLLARLAQDLQDRASVTTDRGAAEALRREAKQIVLDAATAAQRVLRIAGDDAAANIAMAEVLRLQGKPAREIKRYLDTARARGDKEWARDLALADAMLLVRDGKLDEARAALTAIDQGDDKLELSGDVRARLHLAFVLTAQSKPAEARPLVEAVITAQPDHAAARALAAKLDTQVATSDPLPPEEPAREPARDPARDATRDTARDPRPAPPRTSGTEAGGDSYDRLLQRANKLAETSCGPAMELFTKALAQKPNGVEALTGMGYCHIDAKEYSSAFSKFRTALAISPRYEGALRGIAEAYQQQGRKEQAIEAYQRYLEHYPDSVSAKRQLERLGGAPPASGSGSAPPPSGGSAVDPGSTPSPPPSPPPAPPPSAPSPDTSGSSAGSASSQ